MEVGRRPLEPQPEGPAIRLRVTGTRLPARIQRAYFHRIAQLLQLRRCQVGHVGVAIGRRAEYFIGDARILPVRGRINVAEDRVGEAFGVERRAIAVLQAGAQGEGQLSSVGIVGPRLSSPWNSLKLLIQAGQPLVDQSQAGKLIDIGVLLGIHAVRIRSQVDPQRERIVLKDQRQVNDVLRAADEREFAQMADVNHHGVCSAIHLVITLAFRAALLGRLPACALDPAVQVKGRLIPDGG